MTVKKEEEIRERLNQKRLGTLEIGEDIEEVEPLTLVNHKRFDIMAKYIYGKFQRDNIDSSWGYRLYEDHVWVFNNYVEDDESGKKGIKSFINSFNSTLNSIKENGFKDKVSLVPVDEGNVPLDGSHRVASSLLYNKKVKTIKVKGNNTNYNYEFFKQKGLLLKWGDAIAYEYCKLNRNTHIIILFPSAFGEKSEAKSILENYGSIYYEKDIKLTNVGIENLLLQSFKDEELTNHVNSNPEESKKIIDSFFMGQDTISALVFETKSLIELSKVREELGSLYNRKYSAYVSKSHVETISLCQTFFNENSIHFLNHATPRKWSSFQKILDDYKQQLKDYKVNDENFCVISDGVLAAYGIRNNARLDFIHGDKVPVIGSHFNSCNEELVNFKKTTDDIIYNPENHFYYKGIKFATLETIKKIKSKRRSWSEKKDIKLINSYLEDGKLNLNKKLVVYSLKKKLKIFKLAIIDVRLKYRNLIRAK